MDMPFQASSWMPPFGDRKCLGAHKHTATLLGASLLAQGTGVFPLQPSPPN